MSYQFHDDFNLSFIIAKFIFCIAQNFVIIDNKFIGPS